MRWSMLKMRWLILTQKMWIPEEASAISDAFKEFVTVEPTRFNSCLELPALDPSTANHRDPPSNYGTDAL